MGQAPGGASPPAKYCRVFQQQRTSDACPIAEVLKL